MALSVVNFRMHHGNVYEQISFSGNGIKLLDLKKEVLDRKKINRSLDFDLNIVDENGKVYHDDDEFVPKNASLVVKRIPANAKTSLLSRLNNRGFGSHSGIAVSQKSADIVMPMKAEEVSSPTAAQELSRADSQDMDVLGLMQEEEIVLKRTAPIGNTLWGGSDPNPSSTAAGAPHRGGPNAAVMQQAAKVFAAGGGYPCGRCNKLGHNMKYCPTNGDPAFDPEVRLMNIPKNSKRRVANLEGVDTNNKTVIENSDGTYDIFELSSAGLEKLGDSSHLSLADLNMAEVPDNLKCALSATFLREAVTLPCCRKSVNGSVVRQELVNTGLRCPLCSTQGISPDMLIVRTDIRDSVEEYIKHGGKKPESEVAVSHGLPGHPPPPTTRPPPPTSLPPNPYGQQPTAAYMDPYGGAVSAPPMGYYGAPQPMMGIPPQTTALAPALTGGGVVGAAPTATGEGEANSAVAESGEVPRELLPPPFSLEEFYQEMEFQKQERAYLEQMWFQRLESISYGGRGGGYRGGYKGRGNGGYDRFSDRGGRFGGRENRDFREPSCKTSSASSAALPSDDKDKRDRQREDSRNRGFTAPSSSKSSSAADDKGSSSRDRKRDDSRNRSDKVDVKTRDDSRSRSDKVDSKKRDDSRSRSDKVDSSRDTKRSAPPSDSRKPSSSTSSSTGDKKPRDHRDSREREAVAPTERKRDRSVDRSAVDLRTKEKTREDSRDRESASRRRHRSTSPSTAAATESKRRKGDDGNKSEYTAKDSKSSSSSSKTNRDSRDRDPKDSAGKRDAVKDTKAGSGSTRSEKESGASEKDHKRRREEPAALVRPSNGQDRREESRGSKSSRVEGSGSRADKQHRSDKTDNPLTSSRDDKESSRKSSKEDERSGANGSSGSGNRRTEAVVLHESGDKPDKTKPLKSSRAGPPPTSPHTSSSKHGRSSAKDIPSSSSRIVYADNNGLSKGGGGGSSRGSGRKGDKRR